MKKWFTMIELIIVIGIISVLMLTLRNIFTNTNQDFLYAETCINKVYGDINNFIYSAMTSKGLYSNSATIFPEQYTILINSWWINLWYKTSTGIIGIYLTDTLNSSWLRNYYCSSQRYTTLLTGNTTDITISKWLIQDQNMPNFTLSGGDSLFTSSITMLLCYTGNTCKEITKFETDVKTQTIRNKKCILLSQTGSVCITWDQ